MASRASISLDENKAISLALFSLLEQTLSSAEGTSAKSTQATADQAEALVSLLNAIIDVYADETKPTDAVFEQGGYAGHLQQAIKPARALVRNVDKRMQRELRAKGEEAVENLQAFVQYRKNLRR